MRRGSHRFGLFATATVALAVAFAAVPSVAQAASGNTMDSWWQRYGVDSAHSAGMTGAGVKVAVIDEQINPDLPVFAGRDLSVSSTQLCKTPTNPVSSEATKSSLHGTAMAALIIGNGEGGGSVRGIAPDAKVTFYGYGADDGGPVCDPDTADDISVFGYAIKTAVDDGAKIITTSVGATAYANDGPVIAYALARGVAIVAATPNPSQGLVDYKKGYDAMNGVVGATAIDENGNLQSEEGKPLALPQTTVVAAGFNLPSVGVVGDWDGTAPRTGSSNSAPIVAAMLALAAQKYPGATGNQLVHSLIATTNGQVKEPVLSSDGFGYGAAWLPTLLENDPSSYPDDTPLVGKAAGFPTPEQISTARTDGFVPVTRGRSFDDAAGQTPQPGFDLSSAIVWIVAALVGLVVLAAVITVIIIVVQRRKARKGVAS
ncbi:S8 family serine peptidase [uncultured Microbacterium sp.]|uniref:S8 family serine peptidase n=1 Tax=uncultured Microbacterium sp. TaxID=191216 RepID=UPI0025DC2FA6|nr:S8 family serine peptidase [uncultured Microbacterium sp.]